MGHYYSEMACSTCGRIPCSCPPKPDETPEMWLVDPATLEVMQVRRFDKKYEYVMSSRGLPFPGNPYMRRMSSDLFKHEHEAKAHRIVVIDRQIERAKEAAAKAGNDLIELMVRRGELLDE